VMSVGRRSSELPEPATRRKSGQNKVKIVPGTILG